jgi:hypothetical protein
VSTVGDMASVAFLYYLRNEIFTKRECARPLNLGRDRSKARVKLVSYGSLFGRSTTEARHDNWTSYLDFIRNTSGELLEADKGFDP